MNSIRILKSILRIETKILITIKKVFTCSTADRTASANMSLHGEAIHSRVIIFGSTIISMEPNARNIWTNKICIYWKKIHALKISAFHLVRNIRTETKIYVKPLVFLVCLFAEYVLKPQIQPFSRKIYFSICFHIIIVFMKRQPIVQNTLPAIEVHPLTKRPKILGKTLSIKY